MRRIVLQVGQKINSWTVLNFSRIDERRRAIYRIKCDCGREFEKAGSIINSGKHKCCTKCRKNKLLGRRFGSWLVISEIRKSSKCRTSWLCRCDCGNEREVIANNLQRGISTCCFECGHKKEKSAVHISPTYWRKLRDQAIYRKHEWSLTENYIWNLYLQQDKKCNLSGLSINVEEGSEITASLDRINSKIGYVEGNVQWLHKHINLMKYKFDQKYFVEMCKRVADKGGL